uniref:AlNc14C319G10567 protein n=1 Tax=Albugo laibachii Nc14 TaxID=890382 RepID=F0WWD3_9STRA|nr:AlNc14C319G10567 [Albugo laibachii Nc14]|eukprot:CCA25753.1 AlNc14C319G10567 [Albugo laibachii Nc14]
MTCQWIEYLNGLLVQCNCPIIHFITTHEQDLNSASNPIIAHPNASFHVAIHSLLLNIMAISEDLQKMRWALEFFARYYCRFYVSLLDMPHKSPK